MSQPQKPQAATPTAAEAELTLQVLDANGNPDPEAMADLAAFLREGGIEVHMRTADGKTQQ